MHYKNIMIILPIYIIRIMPLFILLGMIPQEDNGSLELIFLMKVILTITVFVVKMEDMYLQHRKLLRIFVMCR